MNPVEKYFNAEWLECVLGIVIGLISLGLGVYFLLGLTAEFYRGIAYVFLIMAVVEFAVCITVVIRSPRDIVRVNSFIQTDKSKIQSEEIPRMITVLKNFVIYRFAEIILCILGLVLYLFVNHEMWQGIGLGLAIQAGIFLVFDYFAESRGKVYLNYLQQL